MKNRAMGHEFSAKSEQLVMVESSGYFEQDAHFTISLLDLLGKRELRSLLNDFFVLTGMGAAVVDTAGKYLIATEGQDICVRFHRVHPRTLQNCIDGKNFRIENVKKDGYLLHKCKNQLWDVVTPIVIEDRHVGNIFLGQFFFEDEKIDYDFFLRQAEMCGFDKQAYRDALDRVPRLSRQKVDTAIDFSTRFSSMIALMAYNNYRLKQAFIRQKKADDLLKIQRDLGIALDRSGTAQESLQLCLKAAMEASGIDAGGVYMVDRSSGCLKLAVIAGVSADFAAVNTDFPADAARTQMVMKGEKVYLNHADITALGNEDFSREKIRSFAVIPINHQEQVIGCLNLASHVYDEMPWESRQVLESIVRDVVQSIVRIQAEEGLRKKEKKYRALVEDANSIILRIERSGKVLFCNRYAQQFFGFSEEEIVGMNLVGTIVPEIDSSGRDLRSMILDIGLNPEKYFNTENENIKRNGERAWIVWTNRPTYDEKGDIVELLCIGNDITGLKQAEQEKKLLEGQLRQAQKMEAIGTMAGGIAHDFNNILASVMGYTELAVKASQDGKQRMFLEQVTKASERAKNLVGQILAFSRQTEQSRQALDISVIVKESLKLLRATIPSTIQIRQCISSDDSTVLADPTQIHQIVLNLCNNATHAMRDQSGILEVGLSNIHILQEMLIIHHDLKEGEYVLLTIRDTGHGIDPAIKDKIFDPFFTTKKSSEGTGLGLSVVYGIVRSHGGAISVQSDVGIGTTFSIYLPKVETRTAKQKMQKSVDLIGGMERILFVDDEQSLAKMVPIFLRNLGYEVVSTTSSIEALNIFAQDPQRFDMVITDMTMPDMTGLELSERMLAVRKKFPIILCTGYHESITWNEVARRGIKELVMKPVSLTDLGLLIRKTLNESH